MKCLFVLLLAACGVRNPQAKAFYDEVEQGSQWKLTFSAGVPWDPNYGYQGLCPAFGPKTARVPDNQITGCEPGCTCEFDFLFDDTARYGPVAAVLTQQCPDASHVKCENDDPEHDDTSDCLWFSIDNPNNPYPADCVSTMTLTRE